MPVISADERCVACGPGCLLQMSRLQRPKRQRWRELRERRLSSCTGAGGARELRRAGPFLAPDPSQIRHARQRVAHLCSHVGIGWILWAGRVELESSISCVECPRRPSLNVLTSRLHRQKDTERQRKTEENVERRPVVTPRYESGGEAQARERPARDRGLPLPKTCAARVVA